MKEKEDCYQAMSDQDLGHIGPRIKNSNLHLCIISTDLNSNTVSTDDVNISLRCWTDNSVYKLLALATCGLEFHLQ